jgi:hypothetical protein
MIGDRYAKIAQWAPELICDVAHRYCAAWLPTRGRERPRASIRNDGLSCAMLPNRLAGPSLKLSD